MPRIFKRCPVCGKKREHALGCNRANRLDLDVLGRCKICRGPIYRDEPLYGHLCPDCRNTMECVKASRGQGHVDCDPMPEERERRVLGHMRRVAREMGKT